MTDRYDDAMRSLRDAPVPDQWDEILSRAARTPRAGIDDLARTNGNGSGRHQAGRRWPLVLAVAATVTVVIGAVALVTRDESDVTTDRSATTGDDTGPTGSTTGPEPPATTTTSAPQGPPGSLPSDVVDITSYPVSACRGIPFTATTPPDDIAGTMQSPDLQDPRLPDAVHGSITGVFPGGTSSRAVFLVLGWPGLQDDAGTYTEGPFPGIQSWVAPYADGWLAEIAAPVGGEAYCPYTVIGLDLDEAEMHQFLAGLTVG